MSDSPAPTPTNRDYQYLATALVLIATFIAMRACYALPRAVYLFADLEVELSFVTRVLVDNYRLLFFSTLLVGIGSLVSVWWRYRFHSLVVALGLLWLWLGSHLVSMVASEPLRRMMEGMAEG